MNFFTFSHGLRQHGPRLVAKFMQGLMLWGLLNAAVVPSGTVAQTQKPSAAPRAFGQLPLAFVPNAGQFDPAAQFQARCLGGNIAFTANEVRMILPNRVGPADTPAQYDLASPVNRTVALNVRFLGTNGARKLRGEQRLRGQANYFLGPRERWRTALPTYGGLSYQALYPGIDLRYDGAEGSLRSTYTLAPGADVAQLRWRYDGAERVLLDAQTGALLIDLPSFADNIGRARAKRQNKPAPESIPELTEQAPQAWQITDGQKKAVAVRFVLHEDGSAGFALGEYDPRQPVMIDPTFTFSSYIGGAGRDYGYAIATDAQNNVYLAGVTSSVNFPTGAGVAAQAAAGGKTDAFIAKLDAAGANVLYSTYLGGLDDDCAFGLAVNSAGEAYLTGYTRSSNFPTTTLGFDTTFNSGSADGFVVKLNAAGNALAYSSYLGGQADETGYGIALASDNTAYVTGYTRSTDFPAVGALQAAGGQDDAFLVRVNAAGSALLQSSIIGGSRDDYGYGVAVNAAGQVVMAGATQSANFPTRNALQSQSGGGSDAFSLALTPAGNALAFSTYLGGSNNDSARSVALDAAGYIYLTGATRSPNFPTLRAVQSVAGGQEDAFLSKLKPDGRALSYSTYLGGANIDYGLGVAVDAGGYATLTGRTTSANFPLLNPLQATFGGVDDAFVTRFKADGSTLLFSSYHGGSALDVGEAVAADAAGNSYLTGVTRSTNLPRNGGGQASNGGDDDAFVVKINSPTPANILPIAALTATPTSGGAALTVQLDASASTDPDTGEPPLRYTFDLGDGTPTVTQNTPLITYTYAQTGTYRARVRVTDLRGAVSTNTAEVTITVTAPGPRLVGLELGTQNSSTDQTLVGGCNPDAGLVRLSAPAPAGGVTVNLTSSLSAASVPATVTVPAGRTTATFYTTTAQVTTPQTGAVTATAGGVSVAQTLTVRPIKVRTLALSAANVSGTQQVTATATLECAATSNTLLTLASSVPSVATVNAATATVAAGASLTTFTVTTIPQNKARASIINVTTGGVTTGAKLTVNP